MGYLCPMIEINGYPPYAFQAKTITAAISAIQQCGGCCVFDETGLGKTITGATIAVNLGARVLVVSPKANQQSWRTILPSATICTKQKIAVGVYDVVLVDEAHNFNNPKNKSYRDLLETIFFQGERFPAVILLTATPLNNTIGELYHMLRLIPFRLDCVPYYSVPIAGIAAMVAEKELKTFERFYADGMSFGFAKIGEHVSLNFNLKQCLERFGGIIKDFCFRTTRQDIAANFSTDMSLMGHFPRIHKHNVEVQFGGELIHKTIKAIESMPFAYYNVLNYTPTPQSTGMGGIMKTLLLKRLDSSIVAFKETLAKIVSYYTGIEKGVVVQIGEEVYEVNDQFWVDGEKDLKILLDMQDLWGDTLDREKIDLLVEKIKAVDGKVVVFTEYIATQSLLVAELSKHFPTLGYNGSDDEKQLETIAAEFDRNRATNTHRYKVLVATDALAEGVNLHLSCTLIHYDCRWNPSRQIQREGRVNRLVRIGVVPSDITVLTFGVNAVVETVVRLEARLTTKSEMADLVLNANFQLDYIQNAVHPNYYWQDNNFISLYGLHFAKGTLFFEVNEFKSQCTGFCRKYSLPEVKIKVRTDQNGLNYNKLFSSGDLPLGYDRRPTNAQTYFNYQGAGEKFDLIFKNPMYGGLLFMDGKREAVASLIDKFQGNPPEYCSLSAFQGDIVLPGVYKFV